MNGRVPVAVLALALVVAGLAARFAVRTLQTARHGDARDFAILYTGAHLFRRGASFYEPDMVNSEGVNRNAALVAEARRLGTLHAHDSLVHIHQFSYPPFSALPFVPFSALGWRHAVGAWLVLSAALLVAAFAWIARAARLGAVAALTLAAIFLTWEPLENSMGLGQINQLVLALLALFVWALASGRAALGGAALAVLAGAVIVLRPPGPVASARLVPELGLVALVLLLIAPNTTINHLVFTLLPLAVLVDATLRDGSLGRAAWLALALVLIGAVDDYYQHPGLTAGPAVLLAGIKTYGLAILAALALTTLRRPVETT